MIWNTAACCGSWRPTCGMRSGQHEIISESVCLLNALIALPPPTHHTLPLLLTASWFPRRPLGGWRASFAAITSVAPATKQWAWLYGCVLPHLQGALATTQIMVGGHRFHAGSDVSASTHSKMTMPTSGGVGRWVSVKTSGGLERIANHGRGGRLHFVLKLFSFYFIRRERQQIHSKNAKAIATLWNFNERKWHFLCMALLRDVHVHKMSFRVTENGHVYLLRCTKLKFGCSARQKGPNWSKRGKGEVLVGMGKGSGKEGVA